MPPTPTVSYTYDTAYPRVSTMLDGIGTTQYGYNPITTTATLGAGRVATIDGPWANDTIGYEYDELGRVSERAINGAANTVTLGYDALGRLDDVTNPLGAFSYVYVGVTGRLDHIDYPLAQLRITAEGRRITVHVGGTRMEPISWQLLLDFDSNEIEKLRSFPVKTEESRPIAAGQEQVSEHWFQRGLALEESGAPIEDADVGKIVDYLTANY